MKKHKSKNKSKNRSRNRNHYSYNRLILSTDSLSRNNSISNNRNPYIQFETITYPLPNELKLPIGSVIEHGNQTLTYFIWLFCTLICAFTSLILWNVISGRFLFVTIEIILLISFYTLLKRFNKNVGYFSIDDNGFRFICDPYPNMNVEILWKNICSEYVVHIKTGGRSRPDYLVFKYKNASNESEEYKLPIENWLSYSPFSPVEKRKLLLKAILKGLARIPDIKINQRVFTKFDIDPKTFEFAPSKRRSENIYGFILTIIVLGIAFILLPFWFTILPPSWALVLSLTSTILIAIGLILFFSWLYPEFEGNISYNDDIN
ncbi:hypothetical protein [Providencia sp. Me31A]|uniref:hypothetical protein n=1 Tax=Providencia sp. Me31A TaxID=3392637 RepID=UPI003D2ADA19